MNLDEIKSVIRAVLMSSKKPLMAYEINRDFKDQTGQDVYYDKQRHSDLEQFLRYIKDVVKCEKLSNGSLVFTPVTTEATEHMHNLVQLNKGKSKPNNSHGKNMPNRNNQNNYNNNNHRSTALLQNYNIPHPLINPGVLGPPPLFPTPPHVPPPLMQVQVVPTLYPVGNNDGAKSQNSRKANSGNKENFKKQNVKTQSHQVKKVEPPVPDDDDDDDDDWNPKTREIPEKKAVSETRETPETRESTEKRKDLDKPQSLKSSNDQSEPKSSRFVPMVFNKPKITTSNVSQNIKKNQIKSESFSSNESPRVIENLTNSAFPADCVRKASEILRSPNFSERSMIVLRVTEMHSPYAFWFRQHGSSYSPAKLEHDMTDFYNNIARGSYMFSPELGDLCAFRVGGRWYRGEITKKFETGKVVVFLFDSGMRVKVKPHHVRALHEDFTVIPKLAFRGRLACVKPLESQWNEASKEYFKNFSDTKYLYGLVERVKGKVHVLTLVDTSSGDENLILNDLMVMDGVADASDTKGILVGPTFDEIESGEM